MADKTRLFPDQALDDLLAEVLQPNPDATPVQRLGQAMVTLLAIVDELGDPRLAGPAEALVLAVGKVIAEHLQRS